MRAARRLSQPRRGSRSLERVWSAKGKGPQPRRSPSGSMWNFSVLMVFWLKGFVKQFASVAY
jgi:hypothetical protein